VRPDPQLRVCRERDDGLVDRDQIDPPAGLVEQRAERRRQGRQLGRVLGRKVRHAEDGGHDVVLALEPVLRRLPVGQIESRPDEASGCRADHGEGVAAGVEQADGAPGGRDGTMQGTADCLHAFGLAAPLVGPLPGVQAQQVVQNVTVVEIRLQQPGRHQVLEIAFGLGLSAVGHRGGGRDRDVRQVEQAE
jgi:hypothetical protein